MIGTYHRESTKNKTKKALRRKFHGKPKSIRNIHVISGEKEIEVKECNGSAACIVFCFLVSFFFRRELRAVLPETNGSSPRETKRNPLKDPPAEQTHPSDSESPESPK